MHWLFLFVAGFFETGWAYFLKLSYGFTQKWPIVGYALCGIIAAFFLSLSMKKLPMSVAYPCWVGIAMIGTVMVETFVWKNPVSALKIGSLLLIIIGIAGLKASSDHNASQSAAPSSETRVDTE